MNITELKTKINKLETLKELQKKYKQIIESKEDIDIKSEHNLQVIKLPYDCGLSNARNELVNNVNTEYTLLLDDDFIFTEKIFSSLLTIIILPKPYSATGSIKKTFGLSTVKEKAVKNQTKAGDQ